MLETIGIRGPQVIRWSLSEEAPQSDSALTNKSVALGERIGWHILNSLSNNNSIK